MAESASAAAKVCAACKKDVTNLPRTKDAQGRYFCKECVDKLKAKAATKAAPATPAAPPVDADVMAKLLADTPGVELCPNCGGGINVGAKICVRCGFNKETGKSMRVVVERQKKEKEAKAPGGGGGMPLSPNLYMVILCAIVGGGFAGSMFSPDLAIVYYVICGIVGFTAWLWAIIAAFKDGDTMYGVVGIFAFIPILGLVQLYYAVAKTWRPYLKMTYSAAVIGGILRILAVAGHLYDTDENPTPTTRARQGVQRSAPAAASPTPSDAPAEQPENPAPADGSPIGG